jgi:hypothetical protein
MNTKSLTPWFPADVKPVRVGVYERDMGASLCGKYSHWNGQWWGGWANTVESAADNANYGSEVQNKPWRGLSADPSAKGGK